MKDWGTKEVNYLKGIGSEKVFEMSTAQLLDFKFTLNCMYRSHDGDFYKFLEKPESIIANKTYFMLQNFFKNKNVSKKLKLILKNTIIDKTLTYALETSTLTKRDRKQLNIFERKMYRRILGPVYDKGKEN